MFLLKFCSFSVTDRHFGSRNCEEHPLQYLLRSSEPQQQQWGLPDSHDNNRTLCCYHQNHHSPLHLKQQQLQLQQHQIEPHYETLEPLEGPPRPLFSSLAAVLNNVGPGIGSSSPCHVAYCGIQSPTDSTDQSSSSFMDTQIRLSPGGSSPDNEMTDSLPNLDRRTGCGAKSIPTSLTY